MLVQEHQSALSVIKPSSSAPEKKNSAWASTLQNDKKQTNN